MSSPTRTAYLARYPQKATDVSVLFADILGFGNLVEHNEDRVTDVTAAYPDEANTASVFSDAFRRTSEGPLSSIFGGFHRVLEDLVDGEKRLGIHVVAFSDCAFVQMFDFRRLAAFSARLMEKLISARVPVRMGMAIGSWAIHRTANDASHLSQFHALQVLGTGVVRAHRAQGAQKGIQILLHPSTARCADELEPSAVLELATPGEDVWAELNVLSFAASTNLGDAALAHAVLQMRAAAPPRFYAYYDNTLASINRQRQRIGREPLKLELLGP